jgi:hypothetical protein
MYIDHRQRKQIKHLLENEEYVMDVVDVQLMNTIKIKLFNLILSDRNN